MYIPKHFAIEDEEILFDFIENNSFGIIVSIIDQIPVATHLPFILDRNNRSLYGHFAKPNPQWEQITSQEVLVIFQGPHHYISSSWYETNRSVPTWNYVSLHVYGTIEIMEQKGELLEALNKMVAKYEEPAGTYSIDESNHEFVEGMMKGIVGFRLNMNRLEGKWKLSQNHSKERQERVIRRLEEIPNDDAKEIAKLMKSNLITNDE